MSSLVLDTHTALWYLVKSPALSTPAHDAIKRAIAGGDLLYVPAISFAEIVYLEEKGRIKQGSLQAVLWEIANPQSMFLEAVFSAKTAEMMIQVPRNLVPEMPDRMIAATALQLGFPLVTADWRIHTTAVPVIW